MTNQLNHTILLERNCEFYQEYMGTKGPSTKDVTILGGSEVCDTLLNFYEVSKKRTCSGGGVEKSIFTVTSFVDDS